MAKKAPFQSVKKKKKRWERDPQHEKGKRLTRITGEEKKKRFAKKCRQKKEADLLSHPEQEFKGGGRGRTPFCRGGGKE